MQKCILHIGTEKTGSSAIQNWLHYNSELLKEDEVFYSKSLGRPSNRRLPIYGRPRDMPENGFKRLGIDTPEKHDEFSKKLESQFSEEIEEAEKINCKTFVISNEHMHSKLFSEEMLRKIYKLISPYFNDVEVLVFLRPQVDMLVSLLSTMAKDQKISRGLLNKTENDHYVDYLNLYNLWNGVFPGKVKIIPYKNQYSILHPFADQIGVDVSKYRQLGRINEKKDYRVAALGRNIDLPAFYGYSVNKNRFFFQDQLPVERPISISRQEAYNIQKRFYEKNKELALITNQIKEDDLTPNFNRYPEKGNIDEALEDCVFSPMLREMVVRFNAKIWIQKAITEVVRAERALAKNNPKNAFGFLAKAENFVSNAYQADVTENVNELQKLQESIHKLKNQADA